MSAPFGAVLLVPGIQIVRAFGMTYLWLVRNGRMVVIVGISVPHSLLTKGKMRV